jgi:hypothetical protein
MLAAKGVTQEAYMRGRCRGGANAHCRRAFLSWMARVSSLAAIVLLAGCGQPGGSGTSVPTAFDSTPDLYHYHCSAACRRGID